MKRKDWNNFFISILTVCTMTGCGNLTNRQADATSEVKPEASKDTIYMNVQVQLPTTGENTTTYRANENRVDNVLLVLADQNDRFIACGEQASLTNTGKTKGVISTTQKIDKEALAAYYNPDGTLEEGKEKIHIYVFCNPTNELRNIFKEHAISKEWMHKTENITEDAYGNIIRGGAVWGGKDHQNGFLMSTANRACIEKQLPERLEHWEKYSKVSTPFRLSGPNHTDADGKRVDNEGNVEVERAVARFDFKDGSRNGDQTYVLEAEEENNAILKVKLTKMALVNMSRDFYYLRRVSKDGTNANALICGTEYEKGTEANYVADTDAATKKGSSPAIDPGYPFKDYFNFCLGNQEAGNWSIDATARSQWYTSVISKVIGSNGTASGNNPQSYHIWRYVTENTIPGAHLQQNGITTGIVFKGQIIPTERASQRLKDAIANAKGDPAKDPILYSYGKKLYVTWEEVRENAFQTDENSTFYKAVFGKAKKRDITLKGNGQTATYSPDQASPDYLWEKWHEQNIGNKTLQADFRKAAKQAEFTLYQSSTDDYDAAGYYCYYFCWNRHNVHGNHAAAGPMEFAVVRNNIYRFSVTGINRLGHPRISENDPNPVAPDTPDKNDGDYLSLSVDVLPWDGVLTTRI